MEEYQITFKGVQGNSSEEVVKNCYKQFIQGELNSENRSSDSEAIVNHCRDLLHYCSELLSIKATVYSTNGTFKVII